VWEDLHMFSDTKSYTASSTPCSLSVKSTSGQHTHFLGHTITTLEKLMVGRDVWSVIWKPTLTPRSVWQALHATDAIA
jgi:hypothetical protein